MYKYSADVMAGYIVNKCIDDGHPIINLQLQKILYFIQKYYIQTKKSNGIFPEDFEAWQFGPVIPSIYYKYSGYGALSIDMREEGSTLDREDQAIVDPIIDEKRAMDPKELVNETHKPGGAWDQVYQGGKGIHQVINKDLIRTAG